MNTNLVGRRARGLYWVPDEVYGTWESVEGEICAITPNGADLWIWILNVDSGSLQRCTVTRTVILPREWDILR